MVMLSDPFKYAALAAMLLAIVFAYFKGRHASLPNGRSVGWTHIPLVGLLIVSVGPSAIAVLLYLGYNFGLLQAAPAGYRFSSFIVQLPLEFALMNWGFVVLYLVSRLSANAGSARAAMWVSAAAMALVNVPLFFLAPEMVANVFDAGQGIGVVQAMLSMPLWFGQNPNFLDPDKGIGLLVFAPLAPMPLLGLIGWIAGRFIGGAVGSLRGETARS